MELAHHYHPYNRMKTRNKRKPKRTDNMATPKVIDLSHHNTIPSSLKEAKAAGVLGVIHKASEGNTNKDEKCRARFSMAMDAGLLWGLYHFIRPGSVSLQVTNFMGVAAAMLSENPNTLLALDYENDDVSLDNCLNWLASIEDRTGIRPVVYSGHVLKGKLGGQRHPRLNGDNFRLWLAQYGPKPEMPAGWKDYFLWQYTDKASVPGITGNVDGNIVGDVSVLDVWAGRAPAQPADKPPAEASLQAAKYKAALIEAKRVIDAALTAT